MAEEKGDGRIQWGEYIKKSQKPSGLTDRGLRRGENQDAIYCGQGVFAVADGVGGESGGREASQMLMDLVADKVTRGIRIDEAGLREMNNKMNVLGNEGATTLVLAQAMEGKRNLYEVLNVGDSAALIIDETDGTVKEVTIRDEEEGLTKSGRKKMFVTQAMGPAAGRAALRGSHRVVVGLKEGQTLVLASDGLTDYIDSGKISTERILRARRVYQGDEDRFVEWLVAMANSCGGKDNISVVSVPFRGKIEKENGREVEEGQNLELRVGAREGVSLVFPKDNGSDPVDYVGGRDPEHFLGQRSYGRMLKFLGESGEVLLSEEMSEVAFSLQLKNGSVRFVNRSLVAMSWVTKDGKVSGTIETGARIYLNSKENNFGTGGLQIRVGPKLVLNMAELLGLAGEGGKLGVELVRG